MVQMRTPYEAVRTIRIHDKEEEPENIAVQALAFNVGDIVPREQVIGDESARPDAWLELGPDVKFRPGWEPAPPPPPEPKKKAA